MFINKNKNCDFLWWYLRIIFVSICFPVSQLIHPTLRTSSIKHNWRANEANFFFMEKCLILMLLKVTLPWEYMLSHCLSHSFLCRGAGPRLQSGEKTRSAGCCRHSAEGTSVKGAVVKQPDSEQRALLIFATPSFAQQATTYWCPVDLHFLYDKPADCFTF